MKGWHGDRQAHSLASRGILTKQKGLLSKQKFYDKIEYEQSHYPEIGEIYNKLSEEELEKYKEIRQEYVDIAMSVTRRYPQKWGDCYTVNTTVAYWLRKYGFPVRVLQVMGEFDTEIEDPELGWTDRASHIVVWYTDTEKDEYINWEDIEDFSTVLNEWDATMVEFAFDDDLGGKYDRILMKLLDIELGKIK